MRVYSHLLTVKAKDLITLVGAEIQHCSFVTLQSPENNVDIIYFGDAKNQPFELRPCANAILPVNNAKSVYIRGSATDKITIGLL